MDKSIDDAVSLLSAQVRTRGAFLIETGMVLFMKREDAWSRQYQINTVREHLRELEHCICAYEKQMAELTAPVDEHQQDIAAGVADFMAHKAKQVERV